MAWKKNNWGEAMAPQCVRETMPSRRAKHNPGVLIAVLSGIIVLGAICAWMVLGRMKEPRSPEKSVATSKKPAKDVKPAKNRPAASRAETKNAAPMIDVPTFDVQNRMPSRNQMTNATPVARQQLRGTQARIERALAKGQRRIFVHDSECYLSNFAIPGEQVPPTPYDKDTIADLMKALDEPIEVDMNADTEEDIQLKNIVQGMKEELREYLKGGGTVEQYLAELQKRQDREADYYSEAFQMVNKSSKEEDPAMAYELWKRTNRHLEEKGIRTMPLPRRLRKFAEAQEP